jgi:hypothetical protein
MAAAMSDLRSPSSQAGSFAVGEIPPARVRGRALDLSVECACLLKELRGTVTHNTSASTQWVLLLYS